MEITRGEICCCVKGASPLIFNTYRDKAMHELLMPGGGKTKSEKASTLKHNPYAEFRGSAHFLAPQSETLLALPSTAFKSAMMTAARDMDGLTGAGVGRNIYVQGSYIPIYGIPKLRMDMVRSAGMNKTPDVRTRCTVPEWACRLTVRFAKPVMRERIVANIVAAAGIISGVGDFRNEKGKGSFGEYELVSESDKDFKRIVKAGGRAAQVSAMNSPEFYDERTADLMTWWVDEAKRRGWEINADGTEAVKANV